MVYYIQKEFRRHAIQYITFTCESSKLLPFLEEKIKYNGGKIEQRIINNFEELIDFDIIINCTGVKAEKLAKDERVSPIRGQVSRVKNVLICKIYFSFAIFLDKSTLAVFWNYR